MKVKLKNQKKDKARVYGAPEWDGVVDINGHKFVSSKQYEVEEGFYEEFKDIFTPIKENNE